ncbi:MAG: cytidylate kinase family protein [Gammaproteobacteria bacterium]
MTIVTITGDLASGKSLIAKELARHLGAVYFSSGLIQREIAAKYGMSTLELNQYSESHPEIDREIDDSVRNLADRAEDLVVDSRMAWHFLPHSFKVFLATNIVRAAERVLADTVRTNEPVYRDKHDAMLKLKERKHSENKRYLQLYRADCSDLSNFDLVVDTTYSVPDDTITTIRAGLEAWMRQKPLPRYWYSPRSILPLRPLGRVEEEHCADDEQAIRALSYQGNLYVHSGHAKLADALRARTPYLPVEIIARNAESVPEGSSAAQFIERACPEQLLAEWEQKFGFQYLALSGRFRERVD